MDKFSASIKTILESRNSDSNFDEIQDAQKKLDASGAVHNAIEVVRSKEAHPKTGKIEYSSRLITKGEDHDSPYSQHVRTVDIVPIRKQVNLPTSVHLNGEPTDLELAQRHGVRLK